MVAAGAREGVDRRELLLRHLDALPQVDLLDELLEVRIGEVVAFVVKLLLLAHRVLIRLKDREFRPPEIFDGRGLLAVPLQGWNIRSKPRLPVALPLGKRRQVGYRWQLLRIAYDHVHDHVLHAGRWEPLPMQVETKALGLRLEQRSPNGRAQGRDGMIDRLREIGVGLHPCVEDSAPVEPATDIGVERAAEPPRPAKAVQRKGDVFVPEPSGNAIVELSRGCPGEGDSHELAEQLALVVPGNMGREVQE